MFKSRSRAYNIIAWRKQLCSIYDAAFLQLYIFWTIFISPGNLPIWFLVAKCECCEVALLILHIIGCWKNVNKAAVETIVVILIVF